MRLIFFIFIVGVVYQVKAQQTFEPGKLTDSIPVANTTNETFALYIPTSYEPSQASPVLFIFEPAGRGRLGVETFIEASETYGHILVCSNNSRNGPYERNFNIAANLFDHVFSRFKINEDQMYLAGFSGGSRLAWAIASAAENIAGVIACGAGLSESASPILIKQEFSYAGICGDRDMNYKEMLDVKVYMGKSGQEHTLITFEGGHSWPPPEEIIKAFDWLAIQALLKGKEVIPKEKIHTAYLRNYASAAKLETEGHVLQAAENYDRVIGSYRSFYALDSVITSLEDLKKGSVFKHALKSRKEAVEKEKELTSSLYKRFSAEYNNPEKFDLQWWKKKLTQLNDKYKDSTSEFQLMLERVQFYVYAMAYSRTNPNLYQSSEKQKNFCKELSKLVYPEAGLKQ